MTGAMAEDIDVRSLASHWTARCVENGVPMDDYARITGGVESWERWCAGWESVADLRCRDADAAEERGATLTAAELRLVATLEYHFGKFLFVHDLPVLRAVHAKAVQSYRQAMVALPWPGRRLDVPYEGTELSGVLRLPDGDGRPSPTVVVVPGLDATKEEMHRLQEVFLRRGMATYSFDGPGQGEAEFDLPLRTDWEAVASAAVDALVREPTVDADRLAVVGVSLGGYFAARAASVEPRFVAGASVGGCYSMGECWSRLPLLTRRAFVVRSGASSDAEGHERADTFTLADLEALGGTPFLVMHGGRDRLFGDDQARRLTTHFGDDAELVVEPDGNHVLHNLAYRVRPAVADWVARRLVVG
ncbi:MAG: alpha/beta fold hydrolase [Streptosporangiales bacterium]|nr:alpha/beta fold hydrolase [Streptosporangiales bacterium]